MSERLRDEQRTASRRLCRLDIKSIGTGIFKFSEAVFMRMIWSAKTGGSDGGGSRTSSAEWRFCSFLASTWRMALRKSQVARILS